MLAQLMDNNGGQHLREIYPRTWMQDVKLLIGAMSIALRDSGYLTYTITTPNPDP